MADDSGVEQWKGIRGGALNSCCCWSGKNDCLPLFNIKPLDPIDYQGFFL